MYRIFITHLFAVDRHLTWFHFLAIVNNVAINMDVKVSISHW